MSQTTGTSVIAEHISIAAGVCGGKPCIAGSRIRVQDIYVWHDLQGKSADEIVSAFPQLSLADVYAALAYFWSHRDEILAQMKQGEELVEAMKQQFPSKLKDRLTPMDAGDAATP